eukprot:TRINITY_DN69746_c0_g1_i1.p1 TRINITY_DN69746_c0_g1~~TRINITY_DN69746_c0_g1_i1.p1  ORF type:complete len:282 (-),score=51.93 TRINITY_DN69746_c0_g1_i1:98-943(-)
MALYPPSGLLLVRDPEICWDSDLRVTVEGRIVPVHRNALGPGKSRFLADLFRTEGELDADYESESACGAADKSRGSSSEERAAFASVGASCRGGASVSCKTTTGRAWNSPKDGHVSLPPPPPVPIQPPCPELFLRALHAITVGVRPEFKPAEFVGFVRLAAFLQSDDLDCKLCEAALSSWRSLTSLQDFRNPTVPAAFVQRLITTASTFELMNASQALDVIALWSRDEIAGGDTVLESVLTPERIEATELIRLQELNNKFVELLSPTVVFNIMKRGIGSFL